jgi:DNA-binding LacI/PurR family transcriptional regulator
MGKKLTRPTSAASKPDAQLYKKIAKRFALKINNGTWPEGFRLPSYMKLAKFFGVGERTIRRTLDFLATEKRIVKTSNSQWIVQKNRPAFSFLSGGVAFVTTWWLGNFWDDEASMGLRKAIELNVINRNQQIRVYYKNGYNGEMRNVIVPGLKDAELDGIILHGMFTKKCLQEYSALNLPVVRVDAPVPAGIHLASVCVDNVASAKDAVERMFQLGHRRIAFCRSVILSISEVDPDSLARQEGFLAGLEECGIKNGKQHIYSFMNDGHPQAVLNAILNAEPRYTAALCVDGGIAQMIENAALKAGLSLPRDLGLACFGANILHSKFTGPRIDFERVGHESVERLYTRTVRQVLMPTIWYEGSTLVKAP